jgi:hypothetical protein
VAMFLFWVSLRGVRGAGRPNWEKKI